jgi:DNA-binding CsgD family transcriptional regulator
LVRAAADALAAGRIPTAFAWCREAAQLEPDAGVRQELEAVRRQALHAGEEPAAGRRLLWAGQDDAARIALDDAVRVARRAGAPIALAGALAGRAELHLLQGRWSEAATQAGESLERAQELGLSAAAVDALVLLARLDALRGDAAGCEHRLADAARLAGSAGTNRLRLASAAGLHLLTRADHPGAVAQLQEAAALARALPAPDGVRVSLLADLAEAQARCGDRDGARAVLDELVALGSGHDATEPHAAGFGAHVVLVAGRVSMLLGVDPDEVRVEAGRVRAATTRRMMPFEAARALLAEGEALRRLRRPTAARPALRRAVEAFGAVGALPWSEHAERELTACGGVVWPAGSGRPASPVDALTPQELQVAQEVAQGRNNVEVAAALFVSRKTVEAHLTRAYRKLGARSRTDLTRILAPHLGTDTSESRPPSWGAG